MLVLSRQRDQSVMIGDDIEVVVVAIRGDKVRLGFKVKRSTPVHRKELYEAIRKSGEALTPDPTPCAVHGARGGEQEE